MTDEQKARWLATHGPDDDVPWSTNGDACHHCPLRVTQAGGPYYCTDDCDKDPAYCTGAKAWLYDHGCVKQTEGFALGDGMPAGMVSVLSNLGQQLATNANFNKAWYPTEKPLASLPGGVIPLDPSAFKHNLKVRVFEKNFGAYSLDELGGSHLLHYTGEYWVLLTSSESVGTEDHADAYTNDEAFKFVRPLTHQSKPNTLLTNLLIIAADEDVLHPKPHRKRNFRKLKQ